MGANPVVAPPGRVPIVAWPGAGEPIAESRPRLATGSCFSPGTGRALLPRGGVGGHRSKLSGQRSTNVSESLVGSTVSPRIALFLCALSCGCSAPGDGGQTPSSGSTPCASSLDCPTGFQCGYLLYSGCAAQGTCQPVLEGCGDGFVCACDGTVTGPAPLCNREGETYTLAPTAPSAPAPPFLDDGPEVTAWCMAAVFDAGGSGADANGPVDASAE